MVLTLKPHPLSSTAPGSRVAKGKKRSSKSHVPTACVNCKKAHLACDLARPCRRCVSIDKTDTCFDIRHKKRGRPKLRDKRGMAHKPNAAEQSNPSSLMTMARSIAPGIANSSFSMTRPAGYEDVDEVAITGQTIMTVFLSMDLKCARVSDESVHFLGLHPQELVHRSFYDFVIPADAATVARIHQCLGDSIKRDHCHSIHEPATLEQFTRVPPSVLVDIANGSQTFKDSLTFTHADGSHHTLDARFYLGGGLGADLYSPGESCSLYMVCLLTKHGQQQQQSHPASLSRTAIISPPLSSCSSPLSMSSASVSAPVSVSAPAPTILNHSSLAIQNTSSNLHPIDNCSSFPVSRAFPEPPHKQMAPVSRPVSTATLGPMHNLPVNQDLGVITLTDPWMTKPSPLPQSPTTSLPQPQTITFVHNHTPTTDTHGHVSRSASSGAARNTHPNIAAPSPKEYQNLVWMHPHDTYYPMPSSAPTPMAVPLSDPSRFTSVFGRHLHTTSSIVVPASSDYA